MNFRSTALYILLSISWLASSSPALAREKQIGLGPILGAPTGISGNYNLGNQTSIDAALAFDSDIYMHGTYLFREPKSLNLESYQFGWYYGLGARLESKKDKDEAKNSTDKELHLGARGAAGLSFPIKLRRFRTTRIEVFSELSVTLNLIPNTDVDLDLAVGGRIYF